MAATHPTAVLAQTLSPEANQAFCADARRWRATVASAQAPHVDRDDQGRAVYAFPPGAEVSVRSAPFGEVRMRIVVRGGVPVSDRAEYRETPNFNGVAYQVRGLSILVGVIHEERPFADDPEGAPEAPCTPVVFGQTVMGFLEKIPGGLAAFEAVEEGGARELREEVGTPSGAVRRVSKPHAPRHNASPSFVATWNELVFFETAATGPATIDPAKEPRCLKVEYVPLAELLFRVRQGVFVDERGRRVYYRHATSNAAWLTWMTTVAADHPDAYLWEQARFVERLGRANDAADGG